MQNLTELIPYGWKTSFTYSHQLFFIQWFRLVTYEESAETQNTLFFKIRSRQLVAYCSYLVFLSCINENQVFDLHNSSGRLKISLLAMTAILIIRGICLSTSSKIRQIPYLMTDGQIYLFGA